jgi:hypothetical protein
VLNMWELFGMKNKLRCSVCGCILEPDSEFDICEYCLDELLNNQKEDKEEC